TLQPKSPRRYLPHSLAYPKSQFHSLPISSFHSSPPLFRSRGQKKGGPPPEPPLSVIPVLDPTPSRGPHIPNPWVPCRIGYPGWSAPARPRTSSGIACASLAGNNPCAPRTPPFPPRSRR